MGNVRENAHASKFFEVHMYKKQYFTDIEGLSECTQRPLRNILDGSNRHVEKNFLATPLLEDIPVLTAVPASIIS